MNSIGTGDVMCAKHYILETQTIIREEEKGNVKEDVYGPFVGEGRRIGSNKEGEEILKCEEKFFHVRTFLAWLRRAKRVKKE